MLRIGIDLGGSKIAAIALTATGTAHAERRIATPAGDYAAIIAALVALVEDIEAECQTPCSVGVGTPGAISPASGLIKNANSVCLNGKPLQRDLEQALGRPVRLANDADCFALSESVDGAAAGARSVFGVIIGTGTGGGIVIDGRLLAGPNAIAGEWGHNPLPWPQADELPGPACYCGKCGCIETFLSGPGLALDFHQHSGQQLSAAAIAARAAQGEAGAQAALHRYADRLARSLASVINLLDPEVIVLGGGMSNIASLYERVPALWGRYVFSDRVDTRLVPARYGDASGVRGAAWLWPSGD
jgi:predicted NBD/HSP70 family sugar kinase